MKKLFLILIFIITLFSLLIYSIYIKHEDSINQACINHVCFDVELAQTEKERSEGLMYRSFLDEEEGMLFIFREEGIYPFWMKNTLISLDIIWINKEMKIVYIERNTPPCKTEICNTYSPKKSAVYVLEINGELSKKYNFNEGDEVKLQ
ncbi:MAG: DUF192 domain-containing protein [Nanoarchaeota archaeon]|nr:DUF192 domain-containing protein [Nanoarchaeota archaeon]